MPTKRVLDSADGGGWHTSKIREWRVSLGTNPSMQTPSLRRAVESGNWPNVILRCRHLHPLVSVHLYDVAGHWLLVATGADDLSTTDSFSWASTKMEDPAVERHCAWNPKTGKGEGFGLIPGTCSKRFVSHHRGQYTCPEHGSKIRSQIGQHRTTFICMKCSSATKTVRFDRTLDDLLESYCKAVARKQRFAQVQP